MKSFNVGNDAGSWVLPLGCQGSDKASEHYGLVPGEGLGPSLHHYREVGKL